MESKVLQICFCNSKEMWKAPVKDWIHDMYEKRQKKAEQKAKGKNMGNNLRI